MLFYKFEGTKFLKRRISFIFCKLLHEDVKPFSIHSDASQCVSEETIEFRIHPVSKV